MVPYLLVLLGGGAGSLARYAVGTAVMTRTGGRFPFSTVIINTTGSFVVGLLMTLFSQRYQNHQNLRLLLVVGFLGGYTTFSSFEWETLTLTRNSASLLGLVNVVGSVVLGYLAVWIGSLLAATR